MLVMIRNVIVLLYCFYYVVSRQLESMLMLKTKTA